MEDDFWCDRHVNNVMDVIKLSLLHVCDLIQGAELDTTDLEIYLNSIKFVIIKCIIMDDNTNSSYRTDILDSLDSHSMRDQIKILCDVYSDIHNSLLGDIRDLQRAKTTIQNFNEVSYMIGRQISSLDTQVKHIMYILSQSHDELTEYYNEFREAYDMP